ATGDQSGAYGTAHPPPSQLFIAADAILACPAFRLRVRHGAGRAPRTRLRPEIQLRGAARGLTTRRRPPSSMWKFGAAIPLPVWRPEAESNRCTRICSPLHSHSAIRPGDADIGGT